jgi:hypothetical protein
VKHMKLKPQQRNEFDRAKQSKAIRMAHYELGMFIGAMYFFEKVARIWSESKPYALLVAIAGVGWIVLFIRWWTDRRSLGSIEKRLEQEAEIRSIRPLFFLDFRPPDRG